MPALPHRPAADCLRCSCGFVVLQAVPVQKLEQAACCKAHATQQATCADWEPLLKPAYAWRFASTSLGNLPQGRRIPSQKIRMQLPCMPYDPSQNGHAALIQVSSSIAAPTSLTSGFWPLHPAQPLRSSEMHLHSVHSNIMLALATH